MDNITITRIEETVRGKLLAVEIEKKEITILLTWHLLNSAEEYNFTMDGVVYYILFPDEVVRGHGGRFVAHKRLNSYLVRVVYEYESEMPVVITLYIASYERYFKGGIHEDKILS